MPEITVEKIDELKAKHGKIFRVVVGGEVFVYRYLTRAEFRELQKLAKPDIGPEGNPIVNADKALDMEEAMVRKCIVWPENYSIDNGQAGVPSMLANYISNSSGFIVDEEPQAL